MKSIALPALVMATLSPKEGILILDIYIPPPDVKIATATAAPATQTTVNPDAPIQLRNPDEKRFSSCKPVERDGIELQKGVVLTEDWLIKNEDFLRNSVDIFMAYPDIYLDLVKPHNSHFDLFFYQRMFLRACMRYTTIYITATRAAAKTFLAILAKYLQCMFIPNHVGSIIAPSKQQAAKISKQKIYEIWRLFPLLEREVKSANFGSDYVDLTFRNGSRLSIVGALDTDRGIRTHSTLVDEVRDQNGEMIDTVVLPQMSVSRRTLLGAVNPREVTNTQVIFTTSAGSKTNYAYEALMGVFIDSILDPKRNFSMGLDYRIPMRHGLIDPAFVKKLRMSSSYSDVTFASEYMGFWQGSSEESWFKFESMAKRRKLKRPEWSRKYREDPNVFYLISVDVGRIHDQTAALVFRVNKRDGKFLSSLVYIEVLGRQAKTKTFERQAIDLKKLIAAFEPQEVIIDTNGLGVGLGDEMIKEHYDERGRLLPAYGFHNDLNYRKVQPHEAPQILYSMKASASLNSQIHSAAYTRLSSGLVRFLISEQDARSALLATKTGQAMSYIERTKYLMPFVLTTKLFEEMANLRIKRTGLDIALERINTRFPKDKYSAFSYAQWRIKALEEQETRGRHRLAGESRQLVFYTGH